MNMFAKSNQKIENAMISGYKSIENGVVSGFKVIEDSVVGGYKKIEDRFVEVFLTPDDSDQEEGRVATNDQENAVE